MSTLHTVNKSPFTHSTFESCLQVCGFDDAILLLEDGVFAAINGAPCEEELIRLTQNGVRVYALSGDIKARGLQEKLRNDIVITDYKGFLELSIKHRCIQSWY